MWLKIKQENSGWPSNCITESDKLNYLQEFKEREKIELEKDKIVKNEALRFIAKIMLNSFWGKLAQKPNQNKHDFFHSYHDYWKLVDNEDIEIENELMLNDETLLAQWKYKDNDSDSFTNFNVAVASYVTAWARLKLYEKLEERDRIKKFSILYYDTDSIFFIENEKDSKIEVGNFLGDLTDEIESKFGLGAKCTKFVSLGPKNYAYEIEKSDGGSEVIYKCKGLVLTEKAHETLTFETMVNEAIRIQNNEEKSDIPVSQIRFKIDKYHNVFTEYFEKIYRATGDKKYILLKDGEYVTVPWGYKN